MRQSTQEIQFAFNPSEDLLRGNEDLEVAEANW